MLFLIYINDLPTQLESSCAIFADTTVHAASSDSKVSCASISADLDVAAESETVGACSSAPKLESLWVSTCTSGSGAGNHGRCPCSPGQTPPSPRISHEYQAIMDWAHQRRARNLFTYDWCFAPTASATSRDYSQGNFHRCHSTTHGICVPSLEWRTNSKPTKTTYKIHFARDMGFAGLHYRLDSTLWFCSTRGDQVLHRRTLINMHTSSPASFSNYGIFIPKVRVPSSSHKKIINIVELCPTVDSPLERTSEGNPIVQYVDQVQSPTKNPLPHLMSTVAFFKLQMMW